MRKRYKIPITVFIVLVVGMSILIFYPKDMPRGVYGMVIESDNVIVNQVSDSFSSPPQGLRVPDIDLHAFSNYGGHTGSNYLTGQYENFIIGALGSGDLISDDEWIFIPSEIEASFVVDARDNQEMLLWKPELSELTDGVESFTMKLIFDDIDGDRYESEPIRENISAGEKLRYVPLVIKNPDGTIELDLKKDDGDSK
jgi:hypothetical protein